MNNPLRLGVAGLGTVGGGVLDEIHDNGKLIAERAGREVAITAVCAKEIPNQQDVSSFKWYDDAMELANSSDIDVFVELMGGEGGIALASVKAALASGKHVVTANKAMLAHHGAELAELAEANDVSLNYEAAIAGAIPVVKVMRESLAGNTIKRVYGIMNGTCNYILTKMEEEGRSFKEVLADAQDLGYAEADPSFDIGGIDAAHKLACMTSLAFGTRTDFNSIFIEGIEHITLSDIKNADELGYKIKLLGVALATPDGIEQRVHPTLVKKGTPIAEVGGVFNAVGVSGDFVDDIMMQGRGAGAHPTASSVVGDIADIARGIKVPVFGIPAKDLKPSKRARMRAHEGGYYVAFDLYDKPGSVACVANAFSDEGISMKMIKQHAPVETDGNKATAPFILITHNTEEAKLRKVLEVLKNGDYCANEPRMIRIERF